MEHYTIPLTNKQNSYLPLFLWHQRKIQNFFKFRIAAFLISLVFFFVFLAAFRASSGNSTLTFFDIFLSFLLSCTFYLIEYTIEFTQTAPRFSSLWFLQSLLYKKGTYLTSVEFSPDEIQICGYRSNIEFRYTLSPDERSRLIHTHRGFVLPMGKNYLYLPFSLFKDPKVFHIIRQWF